MSADRTRVINRTLEILNLVAPATYGGAISSRNKTRNLTALTDMVDEAGLQILKAIAERPNEFRYPFLANVTVTTSGTQMPAHLGPPASILITLYEDGPVKEADRRDYRRIQSYRENLNEIYDNTANHNEFGSSLAGYYDIWDDRFYFTGFSATLSLARLPIRADNTTLIPEILESVWIHLAVGEAAKVGTGGYEMGLIANYGQKGMAELEMFKNGGRQFPETDMPNPHSAVHQLVR